MSVDPASLAIKAGMMALSMAVTMSQRFKGPRLDSLKVTVAEPGTLIPRGWGLWRTSLIIPWADELTEDKVETKGKGGKYTNYRYYGDFIMLATDQPVQSVSRLWLDNRLVFDMTKKGPISLLGGFFAGLNGSPVKLSLGRNFRIYTGAQTEPDPMMAAWCEEKHGPDSTPAWPNQTFMAFQGMPLEKFGNRIPDGKAELVSDNSTAHLSDIVSEAGGFRFSPNFQRFALNGALWDTATRSKLVNLSFGIAGWGASGELYELGDFLGTGGGPFLTPWGLDGQWKRDPWVAPHFTDSVSVVGNTVYLLPYAGIQNWLQVLEGDEIIAYATDFAPTIMIADADGVDYAIGREYGGAGGIHIAAVDHIRGGLTATVIPTGSSQPVMAWLNANDEFVLGQGDTLYRVDPATLTVIDSASGFPLFVTDTNGDAGGQSIWCVSATTADEISILDLTVRRSIDLTAWLGFGVGGAYDPINHAIVQTTGSAETRWLYLDRVGSPGVTLGEIISDISSWAGLDDVDTSALDQVVEGYKVAQGSAKDMIDPLLKIYDVLPRPHDFGIQFIKRGAAAVRSVDTANLVREGDEPRFRISVTQAADLPQRVTITFADKGREHQTNTVTAKRNADAVDTSRVLSIDAGTFVSTPALMQPYADRYLRRTWIAKPFSLALSAQHLALEPGDAFDFQLDSLARLGVCTKMTLRGMTRIDCEFERDRLTATNLGSGEGAELDGRLDDDLIIVAPCKAFVMDLPLLADSHSETNPIIYYGAGDYGVGSFLGAIIWTGNFAADEYEPWNAVDPAEKASWGYCEDALSNDVSFGMIDRASSIVVDMKGGTLTSYTEAEILADATLNQAIVGAPDRYELVQFAGATLLSGTRYQVSTFRRGRRGTEGQMATHQVGDEFILVSSLKRDALGLSDVGTDMLFKGQTDGRDPATAAAIEVDFAGASLKPYAPAGFRATWQGSTTGDWRFQALRRTRLGGAWIGGTTVPLSENSEAYELVIPLPTGGTRVITCDFDGAGALWATWTQAMQTADYGAPQTSLPDGIELYQLSDAVGRGFPASLAA